MGEKGGCGTPMQRRRQAAVLHRRVTQMTVQGWSWSVSDRTAEPKTGNDRMRSRAQIVPNQPDQALLRGSILRKYAGQMRAACRNRTDDLLITSEMLYRLS